MQHCGERQLDDSVHNGVDPSCNNMDGLAGAPRNLRESLPSLAKFDVGIDVHRELLKYLGSRFFPS